MLTRIAVFGDIHANLPALEAVLQGMDARNLAVRYRVRYDVERAAQAIEATEMPDEYADMLRRGVRRRSPQLAAGSALYTYVS